jgi:riboflavin kinase/FMN adenylyltransferase
MITYRTLEEITEIEPTAVAVGNFDGVHLGHQKLIGKTVEFAREHGLKSAVFTFSNHPRNLIKTASPVKNILYQHEKAEIIASLGVDYMIDIPFTKEIMEMDPVAFVQNLLLEKANMKAVFCGFNYTFGYKAEGNTDVLRNIGMDKGFSVNVMPPFMIDDNIVSSTLIRTLIASGQVERCKRYMGRNYEIAGEVVVGNRLGRKLGFPTSNLVIDKSMVTPPNGVYVTLCDYNGVKYPSVTNVGVKPTIGKYNKNVETHIFDFNKELYGKQIVVEFLKKTRDEVKFDNVQDLSEQIVRDCREVKRFHELMKDCGEDDPSMVHFSVSEKYLNRLHEQSADKEYTEDGSDKGADGNPPADKEGDKNSQSLK